MIYQSTGAFPNHNINKIISDRRYDFIDAFEMSSGPYFDDTFKYIYELSKQKKIAIHNYFPVPKEPFVLNLSSQNPEIIDKSIKHIKNSIDLAKKYCQPYYSVHAGFLLDPLPEELGNISPKNSKIPYNKGLNTFIKNVNDIAEYADSKNINLMIENNVCSQSTLVKFSGCPLLFTDVKSANDLLNSLDSSVKILCDYAHLKVSSSVLNFNAEEFTDIISDRLIACHLSDNNGKEDQNYEFTNHSWFWDILPNNLDYYSIEVYDESPLVLENCHNLLKEYLNEN